MTLALDKLSSFQLRALSSCLIVPGFILAIYFGGFIFFLLVSAMLFISFDEWSKMADKSSTKTKDCVYGSAYLSIGLGTLFLLRILPTDAMLLTLALMCMIWACDTGAYFSGKYFQGKKLCPSISPGKTWSGTIGGILAGMITAYIFYHFWGLYFSIPASLLVGFIVSVSAQLGDLIISKYKRYVGVKDTGNIIPGHGGILDRIDSLLLASPVYLICVFCIYNLEF